MSQSDFGTDAERHRAAAAATEKHSKHTHAKRHADHSADAYEHDEATFFTRHRSKLAAGIMIVVVTIFFVMVAGVIRW